MLKRVYVVYTCSYDMGEMLKAFKTKEEAEQYRADMSKPYQNGDDVCYQYTADTFYNVYIDEVELA